MEHAKTTLRLKCCNTFTWRTVWKLYLTGYLLVFPMQTNTNTPRKTLTPNTTNTDAALCRSNCSWLIHDWWLLDARCIVGATAAGCYMIGGYGMQGALWARKGGACSAATRVSVAGNVAGLFCSVSAFWMAGISLTSCSNLLLLINSSAKYKGPLSVIVLSNVD
jgi:hypothetical protein